jgi:hypothetical protein
MAKGQEELLKQEQVKQQPLMMPHAPFPDDDDHPLPHNIGIFASTGTAAIPDQSTSGQSKLSTMMKAIQESPEQIGFVDPQNGRPFVLSQSKAVK